MINIEKHALHIYLSEISHLKSDIKQDSVFPNTSLGAQLLLNFMTIGDT